MMEAAGSAISKKMTKSFALDQAPLVEVADDERQDRECGKERKRSKKRSSGADSESDSRYGSRHIKTKRIETVGRSRPPDEYPYETPLTVDPDPGPQCSSRPKCIETDGRSRPVENPETN